MGVSEMLMGVAGCGLLFHIFAGQPLLIIGTTGPILLFEQALYQVYTPRQQDVFCPSVNEIAWYAFLCADLWHIWFGLHLLPLLVWLLAYHHCDHHGCH